MRDEANLRDFMSRLDSGVYFVDRQRRITFWNDAAEKMTGYSRERALGSRCSDNLLRHITPDGVQLCLRGCPLAGTISDGKVRETDVYMHHSSGHRVPITVWAAPLTDETGTIIGAIEIFSDRRDRSALLSELERLRHEVLSDPLTGLGNRRYLDIMVESRLGAMREGAEPFGLFMADIDHFKLVNDEYGHDVGDKVLAMVAATLSSAVRPLDAAARWGGEEFILICPKVADALQSIAERVRMMVEQSWVELEDGRTLSVTISVGAAKVAKGDSLETLVKRADARMYEAKNRGRNRCVVGD
ncbi:MAG: sensor domain-containing diguanylate cyclase [Spirochaetales bacterium]